MNLSQKVIPKKKKMELASDFRRIEIISSFLQFKISRAIWGHFFNDGKIDLSNNYSHLPKKRAAHITFFYVANIILQSYKCPKLHCCAMQFLCSFFDTINNEKTLGF